MMSRGLSLVGAVAALAGVVASTPAPPSDPGIPDPYRKVFPPSESRFWTSVPEAYPPLPGFRAPIGDLPPEDAFFQPDPDADEPAQRATEVVGLHLASDGLLATTARAIHALGPHALTETAGVERTLFSIGLPADLLRMFHLGPDSGSDLALRIADRLRQGRSLEEVTAELAGARFEFVASEPGYRVATESGDHEIGLIRYQVTRDSYWQAEGAGGNLDVLRQLVAELSDTRFQVTVFREHRRGFGALLASWPGADRVALYTLPLPVSQWAQDNGKAGVVERTDGSRQRATLTPRYASRREEASLFVPGESLAMHWLARAGEAVVHSPLLFQGGNLLAVRAPGSSKRLLLVGEAEIHRNVALGLRPDQVLEAFRTEFGADECLVLPAVSFHIDFDLTVRATGARTIAFVNDPLEGAREILQAAAEALHAVDELSDDAIATIRASLDGGEPGPALAVLDAVMTRARDARGVYPLSFAERFAADATDSGVGNLQRVLVAMDLLRAMRPERDWPSGRHARANLESLVRRERDRARLHALLEGRGFELVRVPSLSEDDRGVNAINGVQARSAYLMPVYGGLFERLDRRAEEVIRRNLDSEIRIIPIRCGESQRRAGGVHCSVASYPPEAPSEADRQSG